jgi:hypothetical protein
MSKKNRYNKQARKKHFLSGLNDSLATKGNAKNSALATGKDILIGVLGGGLIGAAIGRPSFLVGIVTTGAGHYADSKLVQLLGIGMMAANGFQKSSSVNGLEGMDGVKERLKAYKDTFGEKLYLDKLLKKAAAVTGTDGFGELQYFTYPDNSMNGSLAALDDIEQQIEESARQFQGQLRGEEILLGADDDINGLEGNLY